MARIYRYISHRKSLPSRPSHLRFRDLNALLIRKRNRQRKGFPWSHRQITRKSPAGTGEVHSVLALKQTSVAGLTGGKTGERRWGESRRAWGPRREAQFSVEGEGLLTARRAWGIRQDSLYSGMPGGRVLPVSVGRVAVQYSRHSISDRSY